MPINYSADALLNWLTNKRNVVARAPFPGSNLIVSSRPKYLGSSYVGSNVVSDYDFSEGRTYKRPSKYIGSTYVGSNYVSDFDTRVRNLL